LRRKYTGLRIFIYRRIGNINYRKAGIRVGRDTKAGRGDGIRQPARLGGAAHFPHCDGGWAIVDILDADRQAYPPGMALPGQSPARQTLGKWENKAATQ